jgi:hypothetical protein
MVVDLTTRLPTPITYGPLATNGATTSASLFFAAMNRVWTVPLSGESPLPVSGLTANCTGSANCVRVKNVEFNHAGAEVITDMITASDSRVFFWNANAIWDAELPSTF